ncbi:MAG: hypothetical protein WBM00_01735, partial [Solirubrobacterales bacterium]
QVSQLGPISLPHPSRLQSGRPEFTIAHYATDPSVWSKYFVPGLHHAFGLLWPLVVGGAAAGALLALVWSGDRALRWIGGVALFGLLVYAITPLSAAGAEGAPVAFEINIRFGIPALLAGAVLLPLARGLQTERRQWILLGALLVVLLVTDRSDAVLRDPARVFGLVLALLVVLVPAGLLLARLRGAGQALVVGGLAALVIAIVAIGYPLQRNYLRDRFGPGSEIPGMKLDAAYRWARGKSHARIGIVGTTAGFLEYGFFGTDLSNHVIYLGERGPHGSFNAIPDCGRFRTAVNAAEPDYVVTAPFLNFIHPEDPIESPEARWLRGERAASPLLHSGAVTVWRLRGKLDPAACGPANAPLHRVPQQPSA